MWVSQNGCPLHVHHSDGFRIVTSFTESDVYHVHENSSPNYSWLLIFSSRWYIVQRLGQSWPDRIMPGSYPLTSNILCLPASCTCIFLSNQPKLWNVWGRGHERTVFWQLVSAYFRQPGGRHARKVLKSDQRSTGATAETGLQYL